ncbi:MAG: TlpA family protein disulfide reductase [Acidobacteriaceae bacterium]
MKRNVAVIVAVVVAVGLMVWAGVTNYRHRQEQQAKINQPHMILTTPADTPGDAASAGSEGFDMHPLVGRAAPNFTLKDTEGKKVSLADYKGKAVVVDFWATWCAPCKIEIPWLEQFNNEYAGKGLQVLGISEDNLDLEDKAALANEKKDITDKAAQMKINYPVLFDDTNVSTPYGGVDGLPTTFFIDRSGKVVASTVGLVSKDEIEANIKKALSSGAQS